MVHREIEARRFVLDFTVYPRPEVDDQHIRYIADAMLAGADLPPVTAEHKSLRVVDGFHRVKAAQRAFGADAKVKATLKAYDSEAQLFEEAMFLNSSHGRALTQYDRVHCLHKAEELGVDPAAVLSALHITKEKAEELKVRTAKLASDLPRVEPLKRTIQHMRGKVLTRRQREANHKLSGMNQSFYANQLIELIEAELIDTSSHDLMEKLNRLAGLLGEFLRRENAA